MNTQARSCALGLVFLVGAGIAGITEAADRAIAPLSDHANWTGLYFGASVGYGAFLSRERSLSPSDEILFEQDSPTNGQGSLASVLAGYDMELGSRFVVGAFAEYEISKFSFTLDRPNQAVDLTQNSSFWLGGRIGYLPNAQTLLFLSGGYTRAYSDLSIASPPPPFIIPSSPPADGWFVGAGVETMLSRYLALRAEYRYAQFEWQNVSDDTLFDFDTLARRSTQSARLALVYRTDGDPSASDAAEWDMEASGLSWTGPYLGVGAGYGLFLGEETDFVPFGVLTTDAAFGGDGPLGTVLAGYDHEVSPKVVIGAFAEYDLSHLNYSQSEAIPFPPPLALTHMTQQSAWSIGGRLGYVIGCCTMWFASAGYTNAHFDADYSFPPGISADLGNFGGWFAGLGAETRLSDRAALRFELRHAGFQDKVFIVDEITPAESRIEPSTQSGRVSLIYRLN